MNKMLTKELLKRFQIGSLKHMTHIDNLDSIFKYGLLSHNNPYKKRDISNREVNNRRDKNEAIFYHNVHDYVPFYFNPRNAMMWKNKNEDIVVLAFSNKLLNFEKTIITDRNAATNGVRFFYDVNDLQQIDWNLVWSKHWNNKPEIVKQTMMAEVLVYNKVGIQNLLGIYVKNHTQKNYIMQRYALKESQIMIKPDMFFN
ncbi:DUF4433 domain-containing protein [Sulfurimonas sp. NW15]|uniref:DUF4433 domain-containing protein n=1 Tax=Sulfurimonas sp. NW15 TaxID=2922729 RepID=UPI003DA93D55